MAKRPVKKKSSATLLGADEILKNVSDATGQPIKEVTNEVVRKTFDVSETESKRSDKKEKLTNEGRKKFTTMLRPDLRERLNNLAYNNDRSIADVLEIIIEEYFNLK